RYVDGQVLELEPNADYWGGKPKLDKLILRPMPDPATRLAALQSGEVQWAEVPPPDSVAQLRASGFNVLLKQYPHTILFFLNLNDPPFNNPKLLQANFKAVGIDMKITPLEWNNILTIQRASFNAPESRIYNGMFFSVGSLAPTSFMGFLQSRVPPAGCCNPTVYNSDKYEGLIK